LLRVLLTPPYVRIFGTAVLANQFVTFLRIGKKVYLERVLPNTFAVNCQSILINLSSERVEVICFDVTCLKTNVYYSCVLKQYFLNSYKTLLTKLASFVLGQGPKGQEGGPDLR
jgi:hypothetical protein